VRRGWVCVCVCMAGVGKGAGGWLHGVLGARLHHDVIVRVCAPKHTPTHASDAQSYCCVQAYMGINVEHWQRTRSSERDSLAVSICFLMSSILPTHTPPTHTHARTQGHGRASFDAFRPHCCPAMSEAWVWGVAEPEGTHPLPLRFCCLPP
jgi:hypothetical protein